MPNKVFIVGGPQGAYGGMFKEHGWELVDNFKKADLVQFTGGEDVTPAMYGQGAHPHTMNNEARDKYEMFMFDAALAHGIPVAGICRGGQFLNVMCGGEMWQHINNHTSSHVVMDVETGAEYMATSTHHQMMKPNIDNGGVILAYAEECTSKEKCNEDGKIFKYSFPSKKAKSLTDKDIEVVAYPDYQALCFQPHPEFRGQDELADWYFDYIFKQFGLG